MRLKKKRFTALLAILALPASALALPATQNPDPSFFEPPDAEFDDEWYEPTYYWGLPAMGLYAPDLPPVAPVNERYRDFDAAVRINRGLFLGVGEQASPYSLRSVVAAPHVGGSSPHVIGIGNVYAPGGILPSMSQVEIKSSTIFIQAE